MYLYIRGGRYHAKNVKERRGVLFGSNDGTDSVQWYAGYGKCAAGRKFW